MRTIDEALDALGNPHKDMPAIDDVLQAKQVLSARLLRAGLQGGVVGRVATFRVHAAIASAGRNVHAVGIGRKIVKGKETTERCIRIYVLQKIAESLLPPRDRLPSTIAGIPTDVIEAQPAFALGPKAGRRRKTRGSPTITRPSSCSDDRCRRQRPVIAGISVAHRDITAGTLGYFCRSTRHGDDPTKVYVLSNNHVFANVNQAQPSDDLYQPGPADGGTTGDHFADLHRYVPVRLGGTAPNRVDAAIGELQAGVGYTPELCSIGPIQGTARAVEGLQIRKHGRTTGYTEGIVTDESYDALIGMNHEDMSVVALFENQMRLERIDPYPVIGLGGDSGSLVVMKTKAKAVGLYFAGPDNGFYGVANHIQDVLNELEIQLL